ncbi:hypothetical protein [Nonomuraea rhizosphaerae]|uniref:hypothetical protein n=1 Tax=Nonomuraea rhizosphaerae TaxID=2665663 RepID=UPI001C5FBA1D|nr:hypothetical protein [Nonomuraea rhizosphaerae]
MTRLREALGDIAEEAPLVSLADAAIAGHRRRRRTVVATAVVAVLCLTAAAFAMPWPRGARPATQQSQESVPDLPEGQVGAISEAYMTDCAFVEGKSDCDAAEWRVVTRAGATYRVPQALARTAKEWPAPVAISRDGRMLAYYSRDAQAHVVRDLVSGAVTTSPVIVEEERIGIGSMLVLSDDGRYVVFDPREGSKDPATLIDVRTGRTRSIDGRYEAVSVKGGLVELIRYRKTDMWLMPVTGGGKPVRFDGAFIMFSEVAPDGRTVAAVEHPELKKGILTLLDVKTGRTLRKVLVRGLPDARGGIAGTTLWRSPSEVTILYRGMGGTRAYTVDVTTGRIEVVEVYKGGMRMQGLAHPGAASV